jgi:phenylacetaldehyde dehydrogenase
MTLHQLSNRTAKRLEQPFPLWIGGEAVHTEWTKGLINPATEQEFARVCVSQASHVEDAIVAARRSFDSGVWSGMNAAQRAKIMWRLADLIEENAEELGELESLCMGKPFIAASKMEVPFFAETFRYFSGWCTKTNGTSAPLSFPAGDLHGITLLEPVGVVGMILPWNGPLVIAGWKLGPALATGCSCVIKPADITPLSILRFAELAKEAGIPDGVINIVPGSGSVVGAAIASHGDIDKLAFTGSTNVGRQLVHNSADSNLKKMTLELGGKSPVLVWPDADLDAAIDGAMDAIFGNSGQVCVAGSRLYVHDSIRDDFLKRLADKAQKLVVGDPMDDLTQMGPISSGTHLQSIVRRVDAGIAEGAVLICGGAPLDRLGAYYPPTILAVDDQASSLVQEEIFGPVLCVSSFQTEQQAIELANGTSFGLAASVWTRDINRAMRVSRSLHCGIVWVNTHNIPDLAMPIGGYGQSGWGRELGQLGIGEYLQSKSVMINISANDEGRVQ